MDAISEAGRIISKRMAEAGGSLNVTEEEMAEFLSSIPKQFPTRIRFKALGHGLRLRDCLFCSRPSNSDDDVLPEHCYLTWTYLENDKVTVQGWVTES